MNILFLNETMVLGGVEKVTLALANKFSDEGHNVYVFCFWDYYKDLEDSFNKSVHIEYGPGRRALNKNIKIIRNKVISEEIDIIINQNGTSFFFTFALYKATKGLSVKTISVHHNAPSFSSSVQRIILEHSRTKNNIKRAYLSLKKKLYMLESQMMMRYAYYHCDYYMLLSESFIPEFCSFTKITNPSHLLVQTNPITLSHVESDSLLKKEKTIVYVGRLEETQKRISRILQIWKELEKELPDWSLRLVGDGEDRKMYIDYVEENELKRVHFEGFCDPLPFYKKSSVLLLTSDYEGFGLVICEGMRLGTIPIVLASYSSVYDIINNEINGIILPLPFNVIQWKDAILNLVNNTEKMQKMSQSAIVDSHRFDIDVIYKSWMTHFRHILNN